MYCRFFTCNFIGRAQLLDFNDNEFKTPNNQRYFLPKLLNVFGYSQVYDIFHLCDEVPRHIHPYFNQARSADIYLHRAQYSVYFRFGKSVFLFGLVCVQVAVEKQWFTCFCMVCLVVKAWYYFFEETASGFTPFQNSFRFSLFNLKLFSE